MGGFILVVAIIVGVVIASAKYNKAMREKWESAAHSLGLNYQPDGLGSFGSITGMSGGHRVSVTTFTKGSGKSSRSYTRYKLQYSQRRSVDFKIERQGMMKGIGKVFGMQDIEVGNPSFDDIALVQGRRSQDVVRFLKPNRQQKIRQLLQTFPDVVITNDHVEVVKVGKDTEPGVIIHAVRNILSFCDAMVTEIRPLPPLETRQQPLAAIHTEKSPELHPEPEPPPINAESELEVPEPESPEPQPVIVIEEPEEEEAATVVAETLDLRETAEALFGAASGGVLMLSKIFDGQFKGKAVKGSGMLKRVDKFNYDSVFTNCKGVKATYEICEIKDAYSKIKVTAVVKLPPSAYEVLITRLGETMPVCGHLVALDGMMHQLYVSTDVD